MRLQATFLPVIVVFSSAAAHAGPMITYDFTGTVTSVIDNDNFKLNGTIPTGTAATGRFTYEAGVPGFSGFGETAYAEPSLSFSLNIGSGLVTWDPGPLLVPAARARVSNDGPFDYFILQGGEAPPTGLTLPAGVTTSDPFGVSGAIQFTDLTHVVFSSEDIPTSLDLSKFSSAGFTLFGGEPFFGEILLPGEVGVTLDSLTLVPEPSSVPEPASIVGFALGALAIMGGLRRKKHPGLAL